MAHVVLERLGKKYGGDAFAVRDVSFALEQGEFLTLVGPSGCGKSTTLRMIAGLEEITEGELWIAGRRANDLLPKERHLAMVFQSYALFPHLDVAANIVFGLKIKGVPEAERRRKLAWAVEILDLGGLEHRRPSDLSGGERQRVALGRAIVLEPQVLLLDEPLSNLDAKLRLRMRTEIRKLHRKSGFTVIYVTHDQAEALTLSDRIAVYDKGRLVQLGTPGQVYHDPRTQFVAGFIGSPPMNLFTGVRDDVTLGVRPEHLSVAYTETPGALAGRVAFVEMLGADDYLVAEVGDQLCSVRVPAGTRVEPGRPVWLLPAPGKAYWFSARDGERVR